MNRPLLSGIVGVILAVAGTLPQTAFGQQEERVFAFVRYDQGRAASGLVAEAKYQTAHRVFERLIRARGDFRQEPPLLVMENGERYMAWMEPDKGRIGLEEKAFDLCMRTGRDSLNALAALLAHEMVHYYEKHDWNRHFARQNQDLETARTLGHMDEGLKQEAQADYLGGFLAATAGFPVHDLMPALLPVLYQGYGLPAELRGYPSLEERITMSKNAMVRLRELQAVHETAGLLTLTGGYLDAAGYYQYLLREFPSREIANNAGVNLTLAALDHFPPTEFPWTLPLEWDPQSRLSGSRSVDPERRKKRESLLREALAFFDRAAMLDPAYSPAYLNMAAAHVLLGQTEDAAFWLKKGRKAAQRHAGADYLALEGVLKVLEGDAERARTSWQKAGNETAKRNLAVLDKVPASMDSPPLPVGADQIGGLRLEQFLRNPVLDIELELEKTIFTGEKRYPHSRILLHYADNGRRYGVFQLCETGCTSQPLAGPGNGGNREDIVQALGPAGATLSLVDESWWIYPAHRIFFRVGQVDGRVTGWGLYRLSEE